MINTMNFRPNILIKTEVPYEEDTFTEARIANTMIRLTGFVPRCKAVCNNYDTCDRNPEMEP